MVIWAGGLRESTLNYLNRIGGGNGYSESDIVKVMQSLEEAKPETWKLFYGQICCGQKPISTES